MVFSRERLTTFKLKQASTANGESMVRPAPFRQSVMSHSPRCDRNITRPIHRGIITIYAILQLHIMLREQPTTSGALIRTATRTTVTKSYIRVGLATQLPDCLGSMAWHRPALTT